MPDLHLLDRLPGRPCSIAAALEVVGERWALLVVREVSLGNHRFSEIARGTGAPRDRLSARLTALVAAGILERRPYSTTPPRSGYHLTAAGRDLLPVLQGLLQWGDRWVAPSRRSSSATPRARTGTTRSTRSGPAAPAASPCTPPASGGSSPPPDAHCPDFLPRRRTTMTAETTRDDAPADWGTARSRTVEWHDPMITAAGALRRSGLQTMQAIRDGVLPPPPIAMLMQMDITGVEEGRVEFTCTVDESVYNPIGVVHGGLVCTMLDTVACGRCMRPARR